MSLSIWDYIRRRACDATLAGFQDALDYLERQDQAQLMHAAAKSFRKRMHELPHTGGNGNGNGNGGGNHPEVASGTPSPAGGPSPARPKPPVPQHSQQQQVPGLIGAPPASSQPPQNRRPGRPRKEVHG